MEQRRNPRLDELRALAIILVVVFHVAQRWPVSRPHVEAVTQYGEYGVDLFFILSGWLIGKIYWKEYLAAGSVRIGRFIAARLTRTVLPYLAAMLIAWAGVRYFRGERFDWGYFLFIQNYYLRIPFFTVSWSLCVEEHFYLSLPSILFVIRRNALLVHGCLLVGAALPLLCRLLTEDAAVGAPFGFYKTATHFRCDGLILAIWLSYVNVIQPGWWKAVRRTALLIAAPSLIAFLIAGRPECAWRRVLIPTFAALLFASVLVLVESLSFRLPRLLERLIEQISVSSYSIYLIHAACIDLGLRGIRATPGLPEFVHLGFMILLIATVSSLFFCVVEMPVLKLRKSWMGRSVREWQAKQQ